MEQLTVRLYKQVNKAIQEKPMRIKPGKAGTPRADLSAFARQRHNYVTNEPEINPHSRFGLINRMEDYMTADGKPFHKWVDHKQTNTRTPITTNSDQLSEEFQPIDVHHIFASLLAFSGFTATQAAADHIQANGKLNVTVSTYVLIYYKGAKLAVYVPTLTIKAINVYNAFRLRETVTLDKTKTNVRFNVDQIDNTGILNLASLNTTTHRVKLMNTGYYYDRREYYFSSNNIRNFQHKMNKAAKNAGIL